MPRPPPLKLKESVFVEEAEDRRLSYINRQDQARKKRAVRLNNLEEKRLQTVIKQVEHTQHLVNRNLRRQTRNLEKSLQKMERKRMTLTHRVSSLDSITEEDVEPVAAGSPVLRKDVRQAPYGFHFQDRKREPLGRWVRYPKRIELDALSRKPTMVQRYGTVLPPIGCDLNESPPSTAQSEGEKDCRRLPTWLQDPRPQTPPTPKGEEVLPLPSVFKRQEMMSRETSSPTEWRLPTPKWL